MKNKRLVIILSVIIFIIAILFIVCSCVFVLKTVNIEMPQDSSITMEERKEICTNKVFKKNSNIIFLNKTKIIETLEKEYPSISITSIETQFPNTLLIHAEERKEVFYVRNNSSSYIALDSTFKVLNEYQEVPNLTEIKGINVEDVAVGEFVQKSNLVNTLQSFYTSVDLCYYSPLDFVNQFKQIKITDNCLIAVTKFNATEGTNLQIDNPQNNLAKKTVYALSALKALDNSKLTHGTILIQEDLTDNTKIISSYIE